MKKKSLLLRAVAIAAGVSMWAFSAWVYADPPARVARLGYTQGEVSFSPAGESDWVQAMLNRPLTTGDRLWSDADARAEIQVGGAMIRMGANSGVSVLNLDDRIAQLQLTQGMLNVRVRRLEPNQVFEVDTPNLAFTLRQPGAYRIEVDPDGNATTIVVRQGQGDAYGEGASYLIDARQPYRFTGTDLRGYQDVDAPRPDEFDRWASERDRAFDNSPSARYVSRDVVGYQDLDAHGSWRSDPAYGNVWTPNRVPAGWAPYRDGHWAWVDPWGWTWVDDAPWGFAVSHYGRWANLGGRWAWVPGPASSTAYYAPALVVFVGGNNFQLTLSSGSIGAVAWFPLAPREVYRPSYPVSRGYFENVNRSNTVINNTVINNTYNTTNVTNVVYANRQVPGAVVAVPTATFVQSRPVAVAAVPVAQAAIVAAPVVVVAAVAPTEKSVRGAGAQGGKPPGPVFERQVVARTALPPAPVGFAAQQQQLAAKPGKPLDDAARKDLKPASAAPAPVVKVVAQEQEAAPVRRPPPANEGAGPRKPDAKPDDVKDLPATTAAAPRTAPGASTPGAGPVSAAPPAAAGPRPSDQNGRAEPRARDGPQVPQGKPGQRGKGEDPGQRAASQAPGAVRPQDASAKADPAAPAKQPPPPRSAPPLPEGSPAAKAAAAGPASAANRSTPRPADLAPAQQPPSGRAQPAPLAGPRPQEPKPAAAGKPDGAQSDRDEPKREDEIPKQRGKPASAPV